MATKTDVPPNKPLKRLGFVQDTAKYAYSYTATADNIYKRVKSTLPASVQPSLNKAEGTVATYAAPVVARAQDAAGNLLQIADAQVDYVVNTADKTYGAGKKTVGDSLNAVQQMHQTNMKIFNDTAKAYYSWVQGFADWAKDKLNPVKGGKAALEAFLAATQKAKEATDPDVAYKMATDAWKQFTSVPVVAKLLDTAEPVTRTADSYFKKMHDTLVSMGLYKRVVDTAASTLNWATTTPPYRLGAQYMYPWIQPMADPLIEKFKRSKVVNETVNYWKPKATAA